MGVGVLSAFTVSEYKNCPDTMTSSIDCRSLSLSTCANAAPDSARLKIEICAKGVFMCAVNQYGGEMLMRIINIYNIILHLRRCLRSGACSATATLSQTAVLSASMSDRL